MQEVVGSSEVDVETASASRLVKSRCRRKRAPEEEQLLAQELFSLMVSNYCPGLVVTLMAWSCQLHRRAVYFKLMVIQG